MRSQERAESVKKALIRTILLFVGCLITTSQAKQPAVTLLTPLITQGSMVIGKLSGEGELYFQSRQLQVSDSGLFVFGVGRDAPAEMALKIVQGDNTQLLPISVKPRQWQIERVDGLPPSKVNPRSEKTLQRIKKEAGLVWTARQNQSEHTYFSMPFKLPAEGRISGVYGSQRVLNGEPKRPHYGLDVANAIGTPVVAPADGVVSLVHQDMFYSGGTLILDHGLGISSTYIHLNSIEVEPGDVVKQGQNIATIGATGRATGPHLDWRLNWFNTRLDPQLLIQTN